MGRGGVQGGTLSAYRNPWMGLCGSALKLVGHHLSEFLRSQMSVSAQHPWITNIGIVSPHWLWLRRELH